MTISEANGEYKASYAVGGGTAAEGNSVTLVLNSDTEAAFTNTLEAVSPTGAAFVRKPDLWMLLAGLLLGASVILQKKFRREGDMEAR